MFDAQVCGVPCAGAMLGLGLGAPWWDDGDGNYDRGQVVG